MSTNNTGRNPLGNGNRSVCVYCGERYREIQRLPNEVNLCPEHFEDALNGDEEILKVIDGKL